MKQQIKTEINNKPQTNELKVIEYTTVENSPNNGTTPILVVGTTKKYQQFENATEPNISQPSTALNEKHNNSNSNAITTKSINSMVVTLNDKLPKGISNCSYADTIDITNKYKLLANGSYLYENYLIIPPYLVGVYDTETLYNGTQRPVNPHVRACICRLKSCITLCTNNTLTFYSEVVKYNAVDLFQLFKIPVSFANGSVIDKHIVKDFVPFVLDKFCEPSFVLTKEIEYNNDWSLFEVKI